MKKGLFFIISFSLLLTNSCRKKDIGKMNYRDEMRYFVQNISAYAKTNSPGFIIIPQNGHNLITTNGYKDGPLATNYIAAIDGVGREDLIYGYSGDDIETPYPDRTEMIGLLNVAKANGIKILVTDYCSSHFKMQDSYSQNHSAGFISFQADHRSLDDIPDYPAIPHDSNINNDSLLSQVQNFLYLIDPSKYSTKIDLLNAIANSYYDLIIMDLYFNDGTPFTAAEINSLKLKPAGGIRKVICYMSIGEAEDYRPYWINYWKTTPPDWMIAENPAWSGNYKVKYWDTDWQHIIYGGPNSYLQKIINAGFDGSYLDLVDAYEFFEN